MEKSDILINSTANVRYIVRDVKACVKFYSEILGFDVVMNPGTGFAALSHGNLRLFLNEPGAGGAGQSMPDGTVPAPGGWNRFQLEVKGLAELIKKLKSKGAQFRNELVSANAGNQVLLEDPSGNLIEFFEPKG